MTRPEYPTHPDLPGNVGADAVRVLVRTSVATLAAAASALPSKFMADELRSRGWHLDEPWIDCDSECSGQDEDVAAAAREAAGDD